MRARIVKPGLFSDFGLGRLPIQARYLFVGLWCIADREGRLIDSPRFIAGQIFPHDDDGIEADVARWLAQLEAGGFIQRYEVNGGRYILVTNFKKHQQINHREAASNLPAPPRQRTCNEKTAIEQPIAESTALPVDFSREMPVHCQGNARALPGPNGSGIRSGSGISGVRKLPNTPLTPHDGAPPPLTPVEKPVEILPEPEPPDPAPTAETPPLAETSSPSSPGWPSAAADVASSASSHAVTASTTDADAPDPLRSNLRKISRADNGMQKLSDYAIAVTRRMLCDWMGRHADRLPPPDDELCKRLLVAHGMSLDGLRDWLLLLRRRGKRPESVQSWGWFTHLAEAETLAPRDGPAEYLPVAAGGGA